MTTHRLHQAYQIIFGEDLRGGGFVLFRDPLARAFRARAAQYRAPHPDAEGKSKEELSEALRGVALAFDLLADVLGPEKAAWVMPVLDELDRTPRRWNPRPAPLSSVTIDAPRPSKNAGGDVEAATQRLKEALGKLKAQTQALAERRPSPPPAEAVERTVVLGRHLHRRGLITLRQLIAAVAWQRAQRPAVGQIAKSWGILADDQVLDALREKEPGELFCDYAVRRGWMTPFQRLAIVGRQRVLQQPIGRYFVEQGILTEPQIEAEVRALQAARATSAKDEPGQGGSSPGR